MADFTFLAIDDDRDLLAAAFPAAVRASAAEQVIAESGRASLSVARLCSMLPEAGPWVRSYNDFSYRWPPGRSRAANGRSEWNSGLEARATKSRGSDGLRRSFAGS